MSKILDQNGLLYFWNKIKNKFVEKVEGKGLSTNDYTNEDKTKLDSIAEGGQTNVQADWSITDITSDAFIKNKPTALPADGGDADTVNGHSINIDVPANAKFTDTTYTAATANQDGLMLKEDFSKLQAFGDASAYALKSDVVGAYKYRGSVTNEAALPASNQAIGDVYNIQTASQYGAAGANVAWDGEQWDSLGGIFSIEYITNEEIDTILT